MAPAVGEVPKLGNRKDKEKVQPPTPPAVVRDLKRGGRYTRTGFLGEVRPYHCVTTL
jgi:hypothetical protein